MKFDTVIIGGGLSGLTCGIRLLEAGQNCVIVSAGQSALHFSSGSFDLLNELPDGKTVMHPLEAIPELVTNYPLHPYAKLGAENFRRLTTEAGQFFRDLAIPLKGTAHKNHYRITPMGILKPTWLTKEGFAVLEEKENLPWKKVLICNPEGFLDFYPQYLTDAFGKYGITSEIHTFSLPDLNRRRTNPSEMRSIHIARLFDRKENAEYLIDLLVLLAKEYEAIFLPACFGLSHILQGDQLHEITGKPVYRIPTLPPSTIGIGMQQYLQRYFIRQGGVFMLGDSILHGIFKGNTVEKVFSLNHRDIPLQADNYVLATGNYFSRGIIAGRESITEPVFDLDVEYTPDRTTWYNPDVFSSQPYQQFGVKSDSAFRAIYKGEPIGNLFIAGAILEGFNPVTEGSGGGVSILTALHIAHTITSKQKRK